VGDPKREVVEKASGIKPQIALAPAPHNNANTPKIHFDFLLSHTSPAAIAEQNKDQEFVSNEQAQQMRRDANFCRPW
jgi:ankyrin repeat protein